MICNEVPLDEVQKAFNRTAVFGLASVTLTLQPYIFSETHIPEDVFGTKQVRDIRIQYPDGLVEHSSLILKVDANAFRSSKSYTHEFTINFIDCTQLDLGFLAGFDRLTKLALFNIDNIQHCLPGLLPLPRLTTLDIEYCTGMDKLNSFPTLKNGLKEVKFMGSAYNDETVDRLMDWILLSSANTLKEMTVAERYQPVTRVPHQITSFKALEKLWLYGNQISTIKSGAFSFSVPVLYLNIHDNGIKEIEPGAFQGIIYVTNLSIP